MRIAGENNITGTRSLDTERRIWEWDFMPKDQPVSEEAIDNAGVTRLAALRAKMPGLTCVHRGDLCLVTGVIERDMLESCIAVTMVLQMGPWMRGVELWTTFVNVDLAVWRF